MKTEPSTDTTPYVILGNASGMSQTSGSLRGRDVSIRSQDSEQSDRSSANGAAACCGCIAAVLLCFGIGLWAGCSDISRPGCNAEVLKGGEATTILGIIFLVGSLLAMCKPLKSETPEAVSLA